MADSEMIAKLRSIIAELREAIDKDDLDEIEMLLDRLELTLPPDEQADD